MLVHGHTVLVVESAEMIEWFTLGATPEIDALVTRYLYDEGYLAEWFGAEAVEAIVRQSEPDEKRSAATQDDSGK